MKIKPLGHRKALKEKTVDISSAPPTCWYHCRKLSEILVTDPYHTPQELGKWFPDKKSLRLQDEDLDCRYLFVFPSVSPRLSVDRLSSQLQKICEAILQMRKQSPGKVKWLNHVIKMVSGKTVIGLQPPIEHPILWTFGEQKLFYPSLYLQH